MRFSSVYGVSSVLSRTRLTRGNRRKGSRILLCSTPATQKIQLIDDFCFTPKSSRGEFPRAKSTMNRRSLLIVAGARNVYIYAVYASLIMLSRRDMPRRVIERARGIDRGSSIETCHVRDKSVLPTCFLLTPVTPATPDRRVYAARWIYSRLF